MVFRYTVPALTSCKFEYSKLNKAPPPALDEIYKLIISPATNPSKKPLNTITKSVSFCSIAASNEVYSKLFLAIYILNMLNC